jgi:hypothetical protein
MRSIFKSICERPASKWRIVSHKMFKTQVKTTCTLTYFIKVSYLCHFFRPETKGLRWNWWLHQEFANHNLSQHRKSGFQVNKVTHNRDLEAQAFDSLHHNSKKCHFYIKHFLHVSFLTFTELPFSFRGFIFHVCSALLVVNYFLKMPHPFLSIFHLGGRSFTPTSNGLETLKKGDAMLPCKWSMGFSSLLFLQSYRIDW